jgi:PAS domain S-box-containing protein
MQLIKKPDSGGEPRRGEDPAGGLSKSASANLKKGPAGPYNVLVVEDEGLIARDISNRVEALGHKVIAAVDTGLEAIERAPEADIVLMDIRLDGSMDGVEAAARIREKHNIPVVFLTAHADRATVERAKLTEPFGYLVKPLAPAALHTSIEVGIYRHRVAKELEERDAWQNAVLNSYADAMIAARADGTIKMMNQAAEALTGWPQVEAIGQPVSKVVRLLEPDARDLTEDPVGLAILRDAPVALDQEIQLVSRDGHQMFVEGAVAPVKSGGVALGAVLTLRDVSGKRWLDRQLHQAQKKEAMIRLAAGISEEYSHLLAAIRTKSELLLRQFGEYSPVRTSLEEIQQASATAEQVTRRLAEFSTRQVGHPEILSLNGVLRRMSRFVESVAGARVEVVLRPDRGAGRVRADAAQFEQMVMNLILHACAIAAQSPAPGTEMPAADSERGRVVIETGNTELKLGGSNGGNGRYVALQITYTGPETDPDRLFEPSSGNEKSIGLAIAHGIVTEYGGYLNAVRTADHVNRLEVLLPEAEQMTGTEADLPAERAVAEARPMEAMSAAAGASGGTTSPQSTSRSDSDTEGAEDAAEIASPNRVLLHTVLLVDPRERMRAEVHNYFEANGLNLIEGSSAEDAIIVGELHEAALDLLIADEAVADAIAHRLHELHPELHVLRVVHREPQSGTEIRAPFSQTELLAKVRSILPLRPKSLRAVV